MEPETQVVPQISISDEAISHFKALIEKEEIPGMGLRIFVAQPRTPHADVGICFCPPEEQNEQDVPMDLNDFVLYIDADSVDYLEDAQIDYQNEGVSSQLTITAPKLKPQQPSSESSLVEQVEWTLMNQVNPNLASHGGFVSLVEITDDNVVVLRFGGGCHGCGMVDVTLKEGIEKNLKEQYPEITAVKDITDHTSGENPYY